MHIPASMLNGTVCPVTLTAAGLSLGVAAYFSGKSWKKVSAARFAAVTSLIFALQMLNFPVQNGTSGHLIGAMLAVSLLGMPLAVLSMSVILFIQAVFFGDGGMNALGANVINMAVIGAVSAGWVWQCLKKTGINKYFSLAVASLFSVVAAAAACSIELALSGAVIFNKVLPAMLSIHVLIGLGEAVLTIALVSALEAYSRAWKTNERAFAVGALSLAGIAAFLSPFASNFPDGLEWVAQKLSFAEFHGFQIPAMFPDYNAAFVSSGPLATSLAGIIGVCIVFAGTYGLGKLLTRDI